MERPKLGRSPAGEGMTIYWLGVITLFVWISVMLCLTRDYWDCLGAARFCNPRAGRKLRIPFLVHPSPSSSTAK